MKRRLLLITLAMALLLIGVNLISRGEYFSGKVKDYVLAEAGKALGYEVGMESLVFNFFPTYLDIKGPYVKGWDEAVPQRLVSAGKARVYFSLAALLNKEVSIRRIQIYNPSVEVERRPDGSYNADPLVSKIKELSEKKPEPGAYKVEVREVAVFDARLSYKDPAQGVTVVAGSAGVDFRMREKGGYWVGYNIKDVVIRRGKLPPFNLVFAGDVLWQDGKASLEGVRLKAEGTSVKASGEVVWSKAPVLDMKVDAVVNLALLDRLAIWKGGPTGEARVSGVVKGAYPKLKGSGSLSLTDILYAGIRIDDVRSDIGFEKGALSVPSLKSRLLGGTVEGSFAVDFGGEAVRYRSSWALKDLVSGQYTEKVGDLRFIPWFRVSGNVAVLGEGADLSGLKASGTVDLKKYDKPHHSPEASPELGIIRGVHVDFTMKDRIIKVEKGSASSRSSAVGFIGTVGLDGESDLVMKGRSEDIGEISALIGYSDMDGKMDLTAYMRGKIVEPMIAGKARITDASAHGIPFRSASGDVKLAGWELSFKDFLIDQGQGSFLLNGRIRFQGEGARFDEPHFSAKLGVRKVDARKIIAIFYEDIPVNLTADGEIGFNGTTEKFKGEARLVTGAGDVYGQALDKGEVTASLTEKDITFPKVVAVKERDIVTASGGIGFDGTFHGKASSARIDLGNFNLLKENGLPLKGSASLSVTGSGSFDRPEIKADVQAYRLFYKDADLGMGRVEAVIRQKALTLKGTVLDDKVLMDSTIWLYEPYAWRARLTFNEGRFEPLVRLLYKGLPEDISLVSTGVFTGEGAISDSSRTVLSVNFSRLSAGVMGRKLENVGDIAFEYRSGGLAVKSLRLKGDGVGLEVEGGAAGTEQLDLKVKAQADLDVLKKVVEEDVDYIDGMGKADLVVKGDIRNPVITGLVGITEGGLKFRDFPQRFDKIVAELRFDGADFTLTKMDAEIGGGKVSATGRGSMKGFSVDNFSISAKAEGVKVKYPEELISTVDARLSFEGAGTRKSISGDVEIIKARYTERVEWKSWLLQFQKKRAEVASSEQAPAGETALNVRVTAKESIKIDNNVAKLPISADLNVRGTINNPVILGRLESSGGMVYLRNNEFRLINGVAEFADPRKLNPIIDLQAETKVREYLIQLTLSGTLDRIKVALLSDPPLDDVDIITLLTLGRTSEALKGHESAITAGEATSFVTGQLQDAVESRVRRITGFDRFQIDPYLTSSGTSSGPRLTVGKSLFSEKLYITYSSNLGTSEDQFVRMEYIFNKNLSLVGERDELGRFGGDLKFRLEFK